MVLLGTLPEGEVRRKKLSLLKHSMQMRKLMQIGSRTTKHATALASVVAGFSSAAVGVSWKNQQQRQMN